MWSGGYTALRLEERRSPLARSALGRKEVGDPWECRGRQAEVGRLVTLSACRSIPCVFWNIPVSPNCCCY